MATYYVRADGTAAKASATSDSSAATAMNVTTHNAATFAAGDIIVLSANGGKFRTTIAVPSSGASGNPITYDSYNGAILSASLDLTTGQSGNWSKTAGQTYVWQYTLATEPKLLYLNGQRAYKGYESTDNGLANGEWLWLSGVLYLRCDAGNPALNFTLIEAPNSNYNLTVGSKSYLLIQNLTLEHNNYYAMTFSSASGSTNTVRNCLIHDGLAALNNSSVGLVLDTCRMTRLWGYGSNCITSSNAAATLTLTGCTLDRLYTPITFRITSGTSLTITSCTFAGSFGTVVYNATTAAVTVQNSIFSGCGGTGGYLFQNTNASGSISVSYCLLGATTGNDPAKPLSYASAGTITIDGTNKYGPVEFVKLQPLYIHFSLDDYDPVCAGIANNTVRSFNNPNWSGITHNFFTGGGVTWPDINAMLGAARNPYTGVELGIHTVHHINVGANFPLMIASTQTVPTITIGGSPKTLQLIENGATVKTIQLETGSPIISDIKTAVTAQTGWTASYYNSIDSMYASTPAAYLKAVTGQAIATTATPVYQDFTLFDAGELAAENSAITGNVSNFTPVTIAYPGGNYTTQEAYAGAPYPRNNVFARMRAQGYLSARTVDPPNAVDGYNTLDELELYSLKTIASDAKTYTVLGAVLYYQFDTGALLTNSTASGVNNLVNEAPLPVISSAVPNAIYTGLTAVRFTAASLQRAYVATVTNMRYTDMVTGAGDWQMGGYLYPVALPGSGKAVIWQHWGDSNNFQWCYLTPAGNIVWESWVSGALSVSLTSSNTVSINTGYSLMVRQLNGGYQLYVTAGKTVGTAPVASSSVTTVPTPTGRFSLGAQWDGAAYVAGTYYDGYLDSFYIANNSGRMARNWIEAYAAQEAVMGVYYHTSVHDHILHTFMTVLGTYTSLATYIHPTGRMASILTAAGTLSGNGYRLRVPTGVTTDYRIKTTSAANTPGNGVSYLGAWPVAASALARPNIWQRIFRSLIFP